MHVMPGLMSLLIDAAKLPQPTIHNSRFGRSTPRVWLFYVMPGDMIVLGCLRMKLWLFGLLQSSPDRPPNAQSGHFSGHGMSGGHGHREVNNYSRSGGQNVRGSHCLHLTGCLFVSRFVSSS